jgi:hypothetical protein
MIEPEYITEEPHGAVEKTYQEAEECVRRYPGSALLATIVAGIALGLLVRALLPERKPEHRALRLLDEIENRLRHLAVPPFRKAGDVAANQVHTLGQHLRKGEAGLERALRKVGKRVSGLFS